MMKRSQQIPGNGARTPDVPLRNGGRPRRLHDVAPSGGTAAISDGILATLSDAGMTAEIFRARQAVSDIIDLFEGRWPDYQKCNTEYHDLPHTLDTTLTTARLVHGARLSGTHADERSVLLAVVAALYHDAGYIQEAWDVSGTGAKYTRDHVRRSMDLVISVGHRYGLSADEREHVRQMILLTDLSVEPEDLTFGGDDIRTLGNLVSAADLLSQLADRNYLEKLLFLYREFKEAGVGEYRHERHLLEQTTAFYDHAHHRLQRLDGRLGTYLRAHFTHMWGIDRDLYAESIENQKDYLRKIVSDHDSDYRKQLKRGGIVEAVESKYGDMY